MIRRRDVESLLLFVALGPLVGGIAFLAVGVVIEVAQQPPRWDAARRMAMEAFSPLVLSAFYIFGLLPAALASVIGSALARVVAGWPRLLAAPAIGAATTAVLIAGLWWFYARHSVTVEGPLVTLLTASGAVAALVCTALIEWRHAAARAPRPDPV